MISFISLTSRVRPSIIKDKSASRRSHLSLSLELRERIMQAENVHQQAQIVPVGSIQEDDESYAKSTTGTVISSNTKDSAVKVLGLNWNTKSDEFYFEYDELYDYAINLPLSKRSVLKVTAKIFDPIGILTPFTIGMKVLFQAKSFVFKNMNGAVNYNQIYLKHGSLICVSLSSFVILKYHGVTSHQYRKKYHAFSDASKLAYAAVVYVRTCYENGLIDVKLVASKSRVAPLKTQTIPRLELLGALILARLWTVSNARGSIVPMLRSVTVLCWIKNVGNWKQYVQHRVNEICELTSKHSWRHCPGNLNPADLSSRGIAAKDLANNSIWWNGPEFLLHSETATTKKRYSDTTIQRYRNRNLEPEPGTVHNLCKLEHFAPQEIYIIITYRGVGRNSMIV